MKRIERKDRAWEDPSSMSKVTESLQNYSTVLQSCGHTIQQP